VARVARARATVSILVGEVVLAPWVDADGNALEHWRPAARADLVVGGTVLRVEAVSTIGADGRPRPGPLALRVVRA
jgi:hypothetical protein